MLLDAERAPDEAPPESGPRPRVLAPELAPGRAANDAEPDALAEIAGEVCGDVWQLVRALSPLQGAWLTVGGAQLGALFMTAARLRHEGERPGRDLLRRRWPELVPGHAAMTRLVELLVDGLCDGACRPRAAG